MARVGNTIAAVNRHNQALNANRPSSLSNMGDLFTQDRATRAGDKARGMSALEQALAAFGPSYGKGMEMEAKAAAGASNITAGLGGTSVPGSVSAGLTAKFEDARLRGQAGIQQAIASFLSGFRDPGTVTPQTLLGADQLSQSRQSTGSNSDYSNVKELGTGQGWSVGGKQYSSSVAAKWASRNARNPFA